MPAPLDILVFREIGKADVASARAEGNADPEAGGGAQDLRFNPYDKLKPVFERLLTGPRKAMEDDREVLTGEIRWVDEQQAVQTEVIEFWPPTPSRRTMGRISRLPHIRFFDRMRQPEFDSNTKYLLILARTLEEQTWVFLLRQEDLNATGWSPEFRTFLQENWEAKSKASKKFVGYLDFKTGQRWMSED